MSDPKDDENLDGDEGELETKGERLGEQSLSRNDQNGDTRSTVGGS